jgi:hypothetical protein
MLIGYVRVSKGDGSQLLDLQVDALIQAGVDSDQIYQDQVSGRMIGLASKTRLMVLFFEFVLVFLRFVVVCVYIGVIGC